MSAPDLPRDTAFSRSYADWQREQRPSQVVPPSFNGEELRLEDLWNSVQNFGGSRRVSEGRLWATVGRQFHPPPSMTNFSYRIKQLYADHLLDYERCLYPERAMLPPIGMTKCRRAKRHPATEMDVPVARQRSVPVDVDGHGETAQSSLDIRSHMARCDELMDSLDKALSQTTEKLKSYDASFEEILDDGFFN